MTEIGHWEKNERTTKGRERGNACTRERYVPMPWFSLAFVYSKGRLYPAKCWAFWGGNINGLHDSHFLSHFVSCFIET
jgi:hypothetical protein